MKKLIILGLLVSDLCFSKVFIKDEVKLNNSGEEVFVIGENIELNGLFENDFIGMGKSISGNFKIKGDFLSCALNQKISSIVENDFYSIGNRIFFSGNVGGSFTSMARNIEIKNSEIKGSLRIMASNVITTNIKVFQKTSIYGGKLKISGIFSDIILHGDEIEIEKGTKILGDLIYYSPKEIYTPEVEIKGKIEWKKPYGEKIKEKTAKLKRIKFLYSFLSLIFPYILLLIWAPNLLKSTVLTVGRNFIKSLIFGFISVIISSFLILIFLITIIGVPIGLILISIFLSILYISRGLIFIYLSRIIFYKFEDKNFIWILSIIIGILIFNLLSLNPTLKIILNVISSSSGFGAFLMDRFKLYKKLREERFL
jgi:hypothetical protein